jgi:hypothetical protein
MYANLRAMNAHHNEAADASASEPALAAPSQAVEPGELTTAPWMGLHYLPEGP